MGGDWVEQVAIDESLNRRMREIPSVQVLMRALDTVPVAAAWKRRAVDEVLSAVREETRRGQPVPSLAVLLGRVSNRAQQLARPSLRPLINATGVVIHTNLGRSPLPAEIMERVSVVAQAYSTLEYRLDSGGRGSRYEHVEDLLTQLTGADAAMVVNNNAAAVLLALSAMASGFEVIVSRGQLVEIGGSFRIPEVMELSGARLFEVGATNKTHLADYERAVSEATRVILKVHASNFRMLGFTEMPDSRDLAELAHHHHLAMLEDLGSGVIEGLSLDGYQEPSVREVVAAGVDVVTFSGDKLLGGPQAGIIVGAKPWIAAMKKHPLARAVRVDKMTLTALEGVVRMYLEGRQALLPLWTMLEAEPEQLRKRAIRLRGRLQKRLDQSQWVLDAVQDHSEIGGGSMPGTRLATWVVRVHSPKYRAELLENELRAGDPAVIARVHEDAILLDLRTIFMSDEAELIKQMVAAISRLA